MSLPTGAVLILGENRFFGFLRAFLRVSASPRSS